jgi:hypothetical protein
MSPSSSSWTLIIRKNNKIHSFLAGVGTNIHLTQPHPRWNSQNCEGKILTFSVQERITSSETHKPWRRGNKPFPFKSELQGRSENDNKTIVPKEETNWASCTVTWRNL